MIYVDKNNTPALRGNSRKGKAIWLFIAAGIALCAGGVIYKFVSTPSDEPSETVETTDIYCPMPPCVLIFVGGKQVCVYQNNPSKLCP